MYSYHMCSWACVLTDTLTGPCTHTNMCSQARVFTDRLAGLYTQTNTYSRACVLRPTHAHGLVYLCTHTDALMADSLHLH